MNKSVGVIVLAAAIALGIAGCTTTTPSTPETSATPDAAPPTASPTAPADSGDVDELPAPPAGTPAAVAWEALMGPDGEYAAAASYQAVIDEFGDVEPYLSIQAAEERHSDALIRQLERLGVDIPDNPYLGEITAPDDLATAAAAEVQGEVANIAMYDRLLTETTDPPLVRVLTTLRAASLESHLPAFEAAAENGGTLTAEQMADFRFGR